LAGQFKGKYSKEQLTTYLQYLGNRVSEDLDNKVDIFAEGLHSEPQIPLATSLGIKIVKEEVLSNYLGY